MRQASAQEKLSPLEEKLKKVTDQLVRDCVIVFFLLVLWVGGCAIVIANPTTKHLHTGDFAALTVFSLGAGTIIIVWMIDVIDGFMLLFWLRKNIQDTQPTIYTRSK